MYRDRTGFTFWQWRLKISWPTRFSWRRGKVSARNGTPPQINQNLFPPHPNMYDMRRARAFHKAVLLVEFMLSLSPPPITAQCSVSRQTSSDEIICLCTGGSTLCFVSQVIEHKAQKGWRWTAQGVFCSIALHWRVSSKFFHSRTCSYLRWHNPMQWCSNERLQGVETFGCTVSCLPYLSLLFKP